MKKSPTLKTKFVPTEFPLYSLKPDEVCKIQGKKFKVTDIKTVKKEGDNSFQSIYIKQVGGNESVHAPAGLMVTKVV